MSMSRSTADELCNFILNKPSNVLGNKFFDCRAAVHGDVAVKADKFEPKIIVISKFRVFLIGGRSPASLKIEKSFHLLAIREISISGTDEATVTYDDGSGTKRLGVRHANISAHGLTVHLLTAIKHYFPDIGVQLRSQLELVPASLYDEFVSIPLDVVARPCHSFRRTYAAMCDFYDLPYREEVSWDVEKIYTINKLRNLRLDDFSHLLPRDLIPIVSVLQYSSYFTGLTVDGVKLSTELIDVILAVVKKSHCVADLQLRNCGLPRDFIFLFSSAVNTAAPTALQSIDFSKNPIDDKKGFSQLCTVLPKMANLRSITLADCGLSEKSVNLLCSGLYNGLTSSKGASAHGIRHLCLSSSSLGHDISSLTNLISLCTSLRILDLSDSGLLLDKLWPALKYGALQIEHLAFGGCQVGRRPAEYVQTVKEFFSAAVNLSVLNFSNTLLNAEMLKAVLLGLASNQQLKPYELNLDATCDKGCGSVLEASLGGLRCKTISLRDNNLETDMQGVLTSLCSMSTLRKVDLGGTNLAALRRSTKPQHATILNRILLDIVKLYSDDSSVEELILSKAQLGSHISVILNTLGATTTLHHLDISHNEMGNFGARILSKALQLNVSLHSVSIDHNKIGAEGFNDIASALNTNFTIKSIPYPVNDVLECKAKNEYSRCLTALGQVEAALERNRSMEVIELANQKKTLNGGLQSLLDMGTSATQVVEDAVAAAGRDVLSAKMESMVDEFVEQLRREGASTIQESLARLGNVSLDCSQDLLRAEKYATTKLKELWLRDLRGVLSDWRWRELCERSELLLRSSVAGNGSCCSAIGSPTGSVSRVPLSTSEAHRPRSIIGDLVQSMISEEGDNGVNLESPPKPSPLLHLQKARPRRMKVDEVKASSGDSELSPMSRSLDFTEMDEETQSINSEDSGRSPDVRKPLAERPAFRAAMLPEAAMITAAQLRPTPGSPRETPIQPSAPPSESPPPLPTRIRAPPPMSPPSLPPKPEPKPRTNLAAATAAEDEENANSRRSVADMARIFDR